MEAKKVNIFAFLMMIVMCVVTICVSVGKKENTPNNSDEILSLYKKIEKLEEKVADNKGDSAYEVAQNNGFTGNVNEWLDSLKGADGQDAELNIPLNQIYSAYLTETGKLSTDYTYEDFLLEIASGKYSKTIAAQQAYSSTVDICYTYTNITEFVQKGTETSTNKTAYKLDTSKTSGARGGIAAGAGIIYQMFDTNTSDLYDYDTAYIITNYHVAYIENYSNDPNYIVYSCTNTGEYFLGTMYNDDDLISRNESGFFSSGEYQYFLEETIEVLSVDEGISKHFLIGGETNAYYGIYLCGYPNQNYELRATFVGGSADNDIAVLKIERTNQTSSDVADVLFESGYYAEAKIGDSSALIGGEDIIAVGNPLLANTNDGMTFSEIKQAYIDSLLFSVTDGIVSNVSEEMPMESLIQSGETTSMRLIRVSAAINSGNSGGGLYDLQGNLVGIVNAKIASSSYDNIGFAIPINVATGIADQIIYQCDGTTKSSTNTRIKTLTTENLGFGIKNGMSTSSSSVDSNGTRTWKISYNILVDGVELNSLAYAEGNGIKNGDIIKKVSFASTNYLANEWFNKEYELADLLLKVKLDCSQISFTVSRDGTEQTITINLNSSCFEEIC